MTSNETTILLRKALNVLFVANPRVTAMGLLAGFSLHGLLEALAPVMASLEWFRASALKSWHFMAGAVVIGNLPTYLSRKKIDPSIINAIEFIEEQKRLGNIPEWQARQMYEKLLKQVLESVVLEASGGNSEKQNTAAAEKGEK